MGLPLPLPLRVAVALVLLLCTCPSTRGSFTCKTTGARCQGLVGYVLPNSTTLSSLLTFFSIEDLTSLLGANGLRSSTPANHTVNASATIRIPFPCNCTSNATGVSARPPTYTVQPGDGLWHIAAEVFAGLVTYQEIADYNHLANVSLIEVGQKLLIPLPCSCDELNGAKVVHYGHVVAAGSSLEEIATQFDTTQQTLMSLNGLANASLLAGQILDVPLRACNSSVRNDSEDYPLLVANGTYALTANNCVRCSCSSSSWTLGCESSGLQPSSNWSTCPAMQCAGAQNLSLGSTANTTCNTTTCAYAGFLSNQTIFTTLLSRSTCSSSGNHASKMNLSWNFPLVCILGVLLSTYFL